MIVDGEETLEVIEVVPSFTTDEDYLPRTRAQSCFMVCSSVLRMFVAYNEQRSQAVDSEPEAEEARLVEAHRTTSPDCHNMILDINASEQPPVKTNVSKFKLDVY